MAPFAFIIITYNRPADLLELLKNIAGLDRAHVLIQEVIIVNNASTEDYSEVKEYISATPNMPFKYFDAPENLGVAKGRNFALQKSSAPFCIMIDDDAVLENRNCLTNLLEEFNRNDSDREKAIVSFKVLYYDNSQMQRSAFPHKRFNRYRKYRTFLTYYYAGGAHAILRSALDKVGFYPDDFFYGMEEYDLSYRLLEAGYSISYSERIVMLHKESPLGRKPKKEKVKMMWVNKSKVAYRYLPLQYFYSTAFMWSMEYLGKTGFDIWGFMRGWGEIIAIPSNEKRTPVSDETLDYLGRVKARLWY